MAWSIEGPVDGGAVLAGLLEDSGVAYRREGSRFRFRLTSRGRTWQAVGDCAGDRVLFYSLFPTPCRDAARALEACGEINRQVVAGSCFLTEGRLVFRTGVELFEACFARELLARALEYNAAVMASFWPVLAEGVT